MLVHKFLKNIMNMLSKQLLISSELWLHCNIISVAQRSVKC